MAKFEHQPSRYCTPPSSDGNSPLVLTPTRGAICNTTPPVSSDRRTSVDKINRLVKAVRDSFRNPRCQTLEISVADYSIAWERLRRTASQRLLGFIDDKLRYDYDPHEQVFRIHMGVSFIHERGVSIVSAPVRKYLEAARAYSGTHTSQFAKAIVETLNAQVSISEKKDEDYQPKIPAEGHDTNDLGQEQPRYSLRTRSSSRFSTDDAPVQSPVSRQSSILSDESFGSYGLSPDASWLYRPGKYPGVVIEISKSEKVKDLISKAERFILHYNVNVVIGLVLEYDASEVEADFMKGSTVLYVWRLRLEELDRIVEVAEKKVLLNPLNELCVEEIDGSVILCDLAEFVERQSLVNQFVASPEAATEVLDYIPLEVSLYDLARELQSLKREDAIVKANETKSSEAHTARQERSGEQLAASRIVQEVLSMKRRRVESDPIGEPALHGRSVKKSRK